MLTRTVLILILLPWALPDAQASEFARSSAELETLQKNIRILQQELASGREEEDVVTADLDRVEQDLAQLNSEIRIQTAAQNALDVEISALERRAEGLSYQKDEAISQLGGLMRSIYIIGRQSGLRMLVNQQDPHAAARRLTMFRYMTSAKNQQLKDIASLYQQINLNRKITNEKRRDLEIALSGLEQNQRKLKIKENARAEQLVKIRQAVAADDSKIVLYKKREKALQVLLANLVRKPKTRPKKTSASIGNVTEVTKADSLDIKVAPKQGSDSVPRIQKNEQRLLAGFENNRGKLSLPLEAEVRAKFGQKKQESGLRWEGVLFNSQEGQSVRVIYPGQVVFSDWFRGYGQLMVVDHGQGYMSLYGHNKALRAGVGEIVQAQQVIAMASEAGQNPSPGVYFEIRHNGNPDDPLKWCR
ncbi:MAG: peptidoglycan DD-metalloendopeptidase family protein [Arenicellales bacterium]